MRTTETFAEAYQAAVRHVATGGARVPGTTDHLSIGSNFGSGDRPTRELIGYQFEVTDPHSCLFVSPVRSPRLEFAFGLFLWTLAGSDDSDWISYYNPRAALFSSNGRLEASFGHRMFTLDGESQIDQILQRLENDATSRRATTLIAIPRDVIAPTVDFPCALAVQYLLRDGQLTAITYMRSQSVLMVLPYDAFLFMALQLWLAARLGVKAGSYHHISGSAHIYEDEMELAQALLTSPLEPLSVPPMDDPLPELEAVLDHERALRTGSSTDQETLSINQNVEWRFFAQACSVLAVHAARRRGASSVATALEKSIDPSLRSLVAAR